MSWRLALLTDFFFFSFPFALWLHCIRFQFGLDFDINELAKKNLFMLPPLSRKAETEFERANQITGNTAPVAQSDRSTLE